MTLYAFDIVIHNGRKGDIINKTGVVLGDSFNDALTTLEDYYAIDSVDWLYPIVTFGESNQKPIEVDNLYDKLEDWSVGR